MFSDLFMLMPAQAAQPQSGGMIMLLGPIVIMVVMIVILLRAQSKEAKRKQEMLNAIKSGDRILTTGGIYGIVTNVKDKTFIVKIADNVKVELSKNGIVGKVDKDKEENNE